MHDGAFETLTYRVSSGVAELTLNRPDALNAFTTTMMWDIIHAFDLVDADDDVRCVILTGAGRAFCAGADLSRGGASFEQNASDPARAALRAGAIDRDGGGMVALRMFDCLKPVVAAVNGAAVGIGATMLLPADIRVCSTEAKFGFVFARRGLVPEAASSWFLPRIVGISTALEWTLSGRIVPAGEARERGLVHSVHAPGELMAAARSLALSLVEESAPVSVALTRQMLWRMLGASHPMEAHRVDSRAIYHRARSPDVSEGVAAFKEKRHAVFTERVSSDMPDIWPEATSPRFS